jgi:hypothetical protein
MLDDGPYYKVLNLLNRYILKKGSWEAEATEFRDKTLMRIEPTDLAKLRFETLNFCSTLRSNYNATVGETAAYVISYIPGASQGSTLKISLEAIVFDLPEINSTVFQETLTPATIDSKLEADTSSDDDALKDTIATTHTREEKEEEEEEKVEAAATRRNANLLGKLAGKFKALKKGRPKEEMDADLLLQENRLLRLTIGHLNEELTTKEHPAASTTNKSQQRKFK